MKLAHLITAYLFIGFLFMGMYTADFKRKCDMEVAPDVVMVGVLGWLPMTIGYGLNSKLPMTIGYGLNSKGLPSWDKIKCPEKMER